MPRNGKQIRIRLQWAALELFRKRGYEETTAAEIAAKAGVTERTFFRHFSDKRDVLFDGEAEFSEALTAAVRNAPASLGPWDVLSSALLAVKQMFIENRPFTEPRQGVIAATPALQERAMAKTRSLVSAVSSALCERGLESAQANLVAWMGVATMSYAVAAWFNDSSIDLREHILGAFREASQLAQPDVARLKAKRRRISRKKEQSS